MNSTLIYQNINKILQNKIKSTIENMPVIHEISDGVVIRSFDKWESSFLDNKIKYKEITNLDFMPLNQIIYFIPKNSIIEVSKNKPNMSITLLEGKVDISYNNGNKIVLSEYYSTNIIEDIIFCKAIIDSYLIFMEF